ncbi:MAG: hypothetical protein OD817_08585, partial [Gammaproteobacteria bacterium]
VGGGGLQRDDRGACAGGSGLRFRRPAAISNFEVNRSDARLVGRAGLQIGELYGSGVRMHDFSAATIKDRNKVADNSHAGGKVVEIPFVDVVGALRAQRYGVPLDITTPFRPSEIERGCGRGRISRETRAAGRAGLRLRRLRAQHRRQRGRRNKPQPRPPPPANSPAFHLKGARIRAAIGGENTAVDDVHNVAHDVPPVFSGVLGELRRCRRVGRES